MYTAYDREKSEVTRLIVFPRSDTLRHILPTLGKDWTHQGIAHLYHKVSQYAVHNFILTITLMIMDF